MQPNKKDKKLKQIEILCRKDIEVSRIFTANDGFAILTVTENHADLIFKSNTKEELNSYGFFPVMPIELKAKKSIIILRIDDIVYDRPITDIGEEISNQND